jgi:transglutaminase-like putative cysteine protease
MKNCITLLLLFFAMSSFAQNYKFGKVSKEELEEKVHPLDSTAEASYLYSKRRTYYDFTKDDGFRIINEFHHRIKIYNKDGFDKATQTILFYKPKSGSKEKISGLSAVTYNLEGGKVKKTKVSKKDIFEEQVSKYRAQKKITFPEIKEGTVIEIEYKLISPYHTSIDELVFQYDVPVKKLVCNVEIPEYYNFNQRSKGYYFIAPKTTKQSRSITWTSRGEDTFTTRGGYSNSKVDYQVNIQNYDAENIPALRDNEVFVNNIQDYRGGTSYEINYIKFPGSNIEYLSTTWEDVAKSIYSIIGPELGRANYFKGDLANVLQGATSDGEKMVKIFQFMKQKVKWNGYLGVTPDKTLKKAHKEGTGNVAAINLMLVSMLRAAGLDANPVLVSTKENGTPLFPTRDGFNYVVAAVTFPDGFVVMDASEPYSVPNMLPPRALNWQGRLIKKNGSSTWLNMQAGSKNTEDNFISVKIDADGMVEGMMRTKYSNLGALNYRKKKNNLEEEKLISTMEDDYSIEVEEYRIDNKFDLGKPVARTVKFSSEDLVEEINGKLYIKPMLFKGYATNPFKSDERKFPVEFNSPWKEKNTINIQLPEGYTIESSPETKALGLPDNLGLFKYQVMAQGNKVRVVSVLEFNTDKIPANYYEILKGFFGEFVEKQSEKIVLVKS